MPTAPPTPLAPQRILMIRPSALGDVCRTVPVLAALRGAFPKAQIDWMVQDTFAAAVAEHPALTNVVPFPRSKFKRWWLPHVGLRVASWLRDLRARDYDLVLDCQGLARSAIFTRATGARRRIGYSNAPELAWMGVNERVDAPETMHAVDRMMRLAEQAIGAPLGSSPRDMRLYSSEAARRWLAGQEWTAERYVVIAPTTRWPGKLWPPERFAVLAEELVKPGAGGTGGAGAERVIVVGAEGERGQCGPLLDLAGRSGSVFDLVGCTSLEQLMALIEGSAVVVGNDSAALHMAAGFDRPIVGLFGPTDVSKVGPYRRADQVVQHVGATDRLDHKDEALGRELMSRIGTDEVIERARAALGSSGARRGLAAVHHAGA